MKNKEENKNGGYNHFDGDDVTDGDDVIVYEPDGFVVDTKKAKLQVALRGRNGERSEDTKENGIQNGGKIKREGTRGTEDKDKRNGNSPIDKGKENQSGGNDKGETQDETKETCDQTALATKEEKDENQIKGEARDQERTPSPAEGRKDLKVNIYETLEMARNPAFRHYTAGGGVNVVVDLERGVQDGTWKPPLPDSDGGDAEGGVGGSVVDFVTSKAGDYIWIEPVSRREFDVAIGARVVSAEGRRIQVQDDDGNEQWLTPERRIKAMHPTSVQGVEDMISLGDLHEAGILRNLLIRYNENLIYTYTGSILVAVNPYQILPIYTVDQIKLYRGKKIGELPPHIFAIGDSCYNNMRRFKQDQCIVISTWRPFRGSTPGSSSRSWRPTRSSKGGSITCEGRDDAREFADIRSAMKVLMFSDSEVWEITKIPDTTSLVRVARFLGLDPRAMKEALTTRTIFAQGETVVSHLSHSQATDVRDAFVKGIYGRLFIWIVSKVNAAIYKKAASFRTSIGVLDIFGFENFKSNSADLLQLIHHTSNKFLQHLFVEDIGMGSETRKRAPTLSAQFKKSLDSLMKTLLSCQPFFIRCIKPNEFKKPMLFDRELCCRQLRYSGMMETIRIRRAGYPIRHTFREFVERYRFLITGCPPAHKVDCRAATSKICQQVLGRADYQLGHTKVFLKDAHDLFLEQERDRVLTKKITILQRCVRGFQKMRESAIIIQKHYRTFAQKRRYQHMRVGYMRLQPSSAPGRVAPLQAPQGHIVSLHGPMPRLPGAARVPPQVVGRHENPGAGPRPHRAQTVPQAQTPRGGRPAQGGGGEGPEEADGQEESQGDRREEVQGANAGDGAGRGAARPRGARDDGPQAGAAAGGREAARRARGRLEAGGADVRLPARLGLGGAGSPGGLQGPPGGRGKGTVSGDDIITAIPRPSGDQDEDLSEYKFQKYAATYFQGNVNHQYSRKQLKQPLLQLQTQGDQLVRNGRVAFGGTFLG
ncbi:putative myosin-VIIa [Penaeus vannamei]|uniref:Putative myosin-VIIa n=1 Tax=Penaeus vannamei TaxID=6689 RepID=A0A423SUA6_PENVA|nr:putative myosin-VIIa [Penaeus vannamei]